MEKALQNLCIFKQRDTGVRHFADEARRKEEGITAWSGAVGV